MKDGNSEWQVKARVRPGSEKVAFFGDVLILGVGKIMGCPVWERNGRYHAGLPTTRGKTQSFDVLRLEDDLDDAVRAALVLAAEHFQSGP